MGCSSSFVSRVPQTVEAGPTLHTDARGEQVGGKRIPTKGRDNHPSDHDDEGLPKDLSKLTVRELKELMVGKVDAATIQTCVEKRELVTFAYLTTSHWTAADVENVCTAACAEANAEFSIYWSELQLLAKQHFPEHFGPDRMCDVTRIIDLLTDDASAHAAPVKSLAYECFRLEELAWLWSVAGDTFRLRNADAFALWAEYLDMRGAGSRVGIVRLQVERLLRVGDAAETEQRDTRDGATAAGGAPPPFAVEFAKECVRPYRYADFWNKIEPTDGHAGKKEERAGEEKEEARRTPQSAQGRSARDLGSDARPVVSLRCCFARAAPREQMGGKHYARRRSSGLDTDLERRRVLLRKRKERQSEEQSFWEERKQWKGKRPGRKDNVAASYPTEEERTFLGKQASSSPSPPARTSDSREPPTAFPRAAKEHTAHPSSQQETYARRAEDKPDTFPVGEKTRADKRPPHSAQTHHENIGTTSEKRAPVPKTSLPHAKQTSAGGKPRAPSFAPPRRHSTEYGKAGVPPKQPTAGMGENPSVAPTDAAAEAPGRRAGAPTPPKHNDATSGTYQSAHCASDTTGAPAQPPRSSPRFTANESAQPARPQNSSTKGHACPPQASPRPESKGNGTEERKCPSMPLRRGDALDVLGFPRDATPSITELKKAYYQCALQWHPDRPHNALMQAVAIRAFQAISHAFTYLQK
eukprot:GEMP01011352.1.p1 GENE.GEMP01011352.1~~GEMP01011352.1.p1  ORF type:complete len:697 (+),score=198.25 GEMP01011352.1:84-2174(+)